MLEQAIAPWMFALNHTHYARWLPVHIRYTVQLHDTHRVANDQFVQCYFTAQKSAQVLSSIVSDQNHEQLNQLIKGGGGAVGITEDPGALLRWMVASPEVTRLVNELEYTQYVGRGNKHHERTYSVQIGFLKKCHLHLREQRNLLIMQVLFL